MNMIEIMERIPDEGAAYEYLEQLRWDGEPECPHCGQADRCYFLTPRNGKSRATRTGANTQRRLWKCGACRKQFSVLTGTIMHGSKISVRKWVLVIFEMCASKNGISAREIERKYNMAPRSAWFMLHRIREAMKDDGLHIFRGTVVADETYVGGSLKNMHADRRREAHKAGDNKTAVLSLVEKSTGQVRSRIMPKVDGATLRKAIAEQVDMPATHLHTDKGASYNVVASELASHRAVDHSAGEYVRGGVSTNQAENFFSQLKRSIDGTHHHVSGEHLARYLAEFDFRHSTRGLSDARRVSALMRRVGNHRLSYKPLTSRVA
jgi:transposase-like protein